MQLVGFKLNGEIYSTLFTKDGHNYIADLHKGKVRISQLSSVHGELCMSLPLEVEVDEFWFLEKDNL